MERDFMLPHSLNNIGEDACFLIMEEEPFEYIYLTHQDDTTIYYASKVGYEGAAIFRDRQEAERFLEDNNIYGYIPILCMDAVKEDGSKN